MAIDIFGAIIKLRTIAQHFLFVTVEPSGFAGLKHDYSMFTL
jgi:hypothetical protein